MEDQPPDDPPKRGRGRPPKLKTCVRCGLEKRRRDYDNGRDDVCSFCKHEVRKAGGPRGVQGADLVATPDGETVYLPMKPAVREPIMDMIKLDAMNAALSKIFKPMPRCECCYEYRHVARDQYGGAALVCKRCEHQILCTGACHLHHSRVFYPELVQPGPAVAAPSPHEIEALFHAPESEKPKYDAAELADADV